MKSLKFYKYFAFALLALNIVVVLFFILNKPKTAAQQPPHKMGPPPMLNLTDAQTKDFQFLVKQHKSDMHEIMKAQKEILNTYFQTLYTVDSTIKNEDNLGAFYTLEKKKINSTYDHFKAVRALLDANQLQHYQEFVEKTTAHIFAGKKRKHPPRK